MPLHSTSTASAGFASIVQDCIDKLTAVSKLSQICCQSRAQVAEPPPESGSQAALAAVLAAAAPGAAAEGDLRLANLILADVAAIAALGRSPVLCALADLQRLVAAGAAAAARVDPKPAVVSATNETPSRSCTSSGEQEAQGSHASRSGVPPFIATKVLVQRPAPRHQLSSDASRVAQGQAGHDSIPQDSAQSAAQAASSHKSLTSTSSRPSRQSDFARGPQQQRSRALRRQLKMAAVQLDGFLLPWANEQPAPVYASISQAAAEQWDRWQCVSAAALLHWMPSLAQIPVHF